MTKKTMTAAVLVAGLAIWGFVAPQAAPPTQAQEVVSVSGSQVAIYNLAGNVEVVRGSGSDVVVPIERGGDDALGAGRRHLRGRSLLPR